MKTELETLAETFGVNLVDLHQKVCDGIAGVSISHFTDGELQVIRNALEVAGEM